MDCAYIVPALDTTIWGKNINDQPYTFSFETSHHISVRDDHLRDTYFSYKRNCSASERTIDHPNADCLLHPTMFCNKIMNCAGCSDETAENCTRAPCENGEIKINHSVLLFKLCMFLYLRLPSMWQRIAAVREAGRYVQLCCGLCQRLGRINWSVHGGSAAPIVPVKW